MNGVYDMEFAYYNPSDESRSCVVRTMTKLSGKPYETVKSELTALASEMAYPAYNEPEVFEAYKDRLPDNFRKRAEHYFSEYRRAETGAEAWQNGEYRRASGGEQT